MPYNDSAQVPASTQSFASRGAPIRSIAEMKGLFSGPLKPQITGSTK